MNIKILIIAVFCQFYVFSAFAQVTSKNKLTTDSNSFTYKLPGRQFYKTYLSEGSEFYNSDWEYGYVVLENNDRYDSLFMRYNSLYDELVYVNKHNKRMIMLDKSVIAEFGFYRIDLASIRFVKMYYDKYHSTGTYFNVLYSGSLKLLVQYKTIAEKVSLYKDENNNIQNTKYVLQKRYCLYFPDKHFERFALHRKSFIRLFPQKKKELKRLIRKNHLNLNKYNDIISIVKLLDEKYYK